MRRGWRISLLVVLVLTLIAAFSFSYADTAASRRICDPTVIRHGFNLAKQGSIIYAPPSSQKTESIKTSVGASAALETLCLLCAQNDQAAALRQCPAKRERARQRIIYIYVNHPHHAPPSEI